MWTIRRTAISILIAGTIGLQAAASFGFLHRYRYWPFLSYPMYNRPHYRGEAVARYSLVGIDGSGRETPITPDDLGLDFWRYLRGPVKAAQKRDAHGLLSHLQPYEHRKRVTLAAVRLDNAPVSLENGLVVEKPVESETVVLRRR